MKSRLRTNFMVPIGIISFIMLGTTTFIYIQDLTQNYLETIEKSAEALAQPLIEKIQGFDPENLDIMLNTLSLKCMELYEFNKEKNFSHFAVINSSGVIVIKLLSHQDLLRSMFQNRYYFQQKVMILITMK